MTRKGIVVLAAAALAAAGVAGAFALQGRRARAQAEEARAEALLAEANGVLAESARENIVALAAEGFAEARALVGTAEELLARRKTAEAVPASQAALDRARRAREEALGRIHVARAATLRALRNKVFYRAAEGVTWSDARADMSLFDRDRISTKERSTAVVRFDEGNEMRLEENSVMVVERMVEDRTQATVSLSLAVPEGRARSVIRREADRDVRLEINLPRADVVLDTRTAAGGRAEVGTQVDEKQGNRVAVYTGSAEVVTPAGEKVVVQQNQYAEVTPDGRLSAPRELPASAITLLPGRNATVYISSQRPEVTFKWKAEKSCARYRLEIARDEEFLDPVIDEPLARASFTYGNLRPGKYRWRVSCLDAQGNQGPYSETSTFEVLVDNDAPRLAVVAPEANAVVAAASIEARCRTEPGVAVFINGEEATSRGGEYARLVELVPGVNTLVFEAVDAAGNVIYNSRLVTRKP